MTPELALLVRALLLGVLVLSLEHVSKHLRAKRWETRRTAVRLPATLNPVVTALSGRPVQVSVSEVITKPAPTVPLSATGHLKIVRLEPRAPDYTAGKKAA